MVEPTNLADVVSSPALTAYERLKELQNMAVVVDPIQFQMWREQKQKNGYETTLHPNSTTLFEDGWETYHGMGNSRDGMFTPLLELYVAGHNTVYIYNLRSELTKNLSSLRQKDGCEL